MAKFFKITAIILLSFIILFLALFLTFAIITRDAKLDESRLINPNQTIYIYDENGNEIVGANVTNKQKSVKLSELNDYTVNAFIASEDRNFYSHNGLNYGRMLKALFNNIKASAIKEGASTISQQLIKNTHLSGEKTLTRKLKEINLTKKLEKNYSKDEILEMYLNTIYFGHSCYGLQSAANFYFDKKAEELSLEESATIVGLLASPNNYSPFKNPEKSLKKRNTVLKAMQDCNFIDSETYSKAVNSPLVTAPQTGTGKNADYLNSVFEELEETDFDFYDLTDNCKIYTYMNSEMQNYIESIDFETDNAVIITASGGGVSAYKSTISNAKRQPGSTFKPLLVYGPALEEKIINPYTKLLDEKIDYNGYSPENYDKKYHGYVSVTESVKQSYNVPAVKTLNALTLKTAEKYLTRMNIGLENDEKNLSLALGGMKYGLDLKQLADSYSVFSHSGIYTPTHFIKKIVSKDGKEIYKSQLSESRVFSEGTCALMNDMLIQTTQSGTAKKLKNFKFDLATKTGTCGNKDGNTDAYAVSYTKNHTICVWLGDKDNKRMQITGGNDCCEYMKDIVSNLYKNHSPATLDTKSGTVSVNIDAEEYNNNNKIVLADPLTPKINIMNIKVLSGCEPKELSTRFSNPTINTPKISVKDNAVNIELCQTKYYSYLINRQENDKTELIYEGKWKELIKDSPKNGYYTYTVTPYFFDGKNKIYGKEISLPPISINNNSSQSPQIKIPDIANKDWFNQ